MPTLVTSSLELPPTQIPPRKRWTRKQCVELEKTGVLNHEKLELVDGELISKMEKIVVTSTHSTSCFGGFTILSEESS